jgi:hypothetical protein
MGTSSFLTREVRLSRTSSSPKHSRFALSPPLATAFALAALAALALASPALALNGNRGPNGGADGRIEYWPRGMPEGYDCQSVLRVDPFPNLNKLLIPGFSFLIDAYSSTGQIEQVRATLVRWSSKELITLKDVIDGQEILFPVAAIMDIYPHTIEELLEDYFENAVQEEDLLKVEIRDLEADAECELWGEYLNLIKRPGAGGQGHDSELILADMDHKHVSQKSLSEVNPYEIRNYRRDQSAFIRDYFLQLDDAKKIWDLRLKREGRSRYRWEQVRILKFTQDSVLLEERKLKFREWVPFNRIQIQSQGAYLGEDYSRWADADSK